MLPKSRHPKGNGRAILNDSLDRCAEHGPAQFVMPDVLELPPINQHGNVMEIARQFGGEGRLVEAVTRLQTLLYAAQEVAENLTRRGSWDS